LLLEGQEKFIIYFFLESDFWEVQNFNLKHIWGKTRNLMGLIFVVGMSTKI
jgi:hypothetical protein